MKDKFCIETACLGTDQGLKLKCRHNHSCDVKNKDNEMKNYGGKSEAEQIVNCKKHFCK